MSALRIDVLRAEFEGLEWVVQHNAAVAYARGWESIAAFNSRQIAEHYATDCKRDNPRASYRVLELSTIQPTHTIILEA